MMRTLIAGGFAIAVAASCAAAYAYRALQPRPPAASGDGIRVLAVGDSITYGVGVDDRDRYSYPAQLGARLGAGYHVLNYGLSGRALQDAADYPYRRTAFYRRGLAANPRIVLIMLGTNDSKPHNWNAARYERNLVEYVNAYKALATRPSIYLMTPPAVFTDRFRVAGAIVSNEIVPIVRRVATQTDVRVIDVFTASREHPAYFPDGVHPDRAGAALIAETIAKVLVEGAARGIPPTAVRLPR